MGLVGRELTLHGLVGPDTADVRLGQQLFPFASGAPREDRPDLGNQVFVICMVCLGGGEAAVGYELFPLHGPAECSPLVLE